MDASTFDLAIPQGWTPAPRPRRGLNARALARVHEYIDSHLGEPLSLQTLAGVACVSRFHFARMFRLSMGMSPMRYVGRRRVESARRMLVEGGTALCDVAATLGFCDQSHFTRAFRKATGFTPGAYASHRLSQSGEAFMPLSGVSPYAARP